MDEKEVLEQGERAIHDCLDHVPFLKIREQRVDVTYISRYYVRHEHEADATDG